MKLRLLHVVPELVPSGLTDQLRLLCAHLPGEQYDVRVLCLGGDGPMRSVLAQQGVSVQWLDRRRTLDWTALRRLVAQLRCDPPDVVHVWSYDRSWAALWSAAQLTTARVIAWRCESPAGRSKVERVVDRQLIARTDCLVVNHQRLYEDYVAAGYRTPAVRRIPSGVQPVAPDPAIRSRWLDRLQLAEKVRLIGVFEPLQANSRLKDLIWSADLLKVIQDDVHLVIVGQGREHWRLQRYRAQVQLADQVHFLGTDPEAWRLLPHLDCVWSANRRAIVPSGLLQAMASGVPVVASDIPEHRALIVPDQTGFLVSLGDRAGFARATKRLWEDEALTGQLTQAARQAVLQQFGAEAMAEQYRQLYRSLQA